MAKHTPGTWTAHKLENGTIVIKEAGLFEKGYSDRIAELHEYPQNIEANSKLIAAAPELLEALEETANTLKFLSEHLTEAGKMELQKALLAIQKATN